MLHDSTTENQQVCAHDIAHYRKQGSSMLITVPKSLREFLDWKEGEVLMVSVMNNSLVILPARRRMIEALEEYVKQTESIN